MAKINSNYRKLSAGYLFQEIARRTKEFTETNPGIKIMKLGIGNTTESITPTILKGLHFGVEKLGKAETYSGYGDEQGDKCLREALVKHYEKKGIILDISEIFISDGAKPDTANIQSIFSLENIIAVQDPSYPVYVDTNVIAGRTNKFNEKKGQYDGIVYMPCVEENNFFPEIPNKKVDIIYLCFPNNPTGATATKEQLKKFVDYAIKNKAIIIFDAAYSAFISDSDLPKSIYEIEESKKCSIEINSFSKIAGFTGIRLGWTIVPKDLIVENSEFGELNNMWNRRQTTFFNGASNIAQEGGLVALTEQGQKECKILADYYMTNAKIIKQGLESIGLKVYGGENAPYLWIKIPNRMDSWDFFNKLLNETHVVGTPGSGFGPSGQGYFRLSAFGHRKDIEEAVESIKNNLTFNFELDKIEA
ncbi:LL-diaminopimelate aminotransferase [Patescibacteria group bacterium]|nr:LL-diaminopimelate aminotransferase [Patescibacteria group bacterium]